MSRTWGELLGEIEAAPEDEGERSGFLSKLRGSLGRSGRAVAATMPRLRSGGEEAWEELEEALIAADVGVAATTELVERLRKQRPDDPAEALVGELVDLLPDPGTLDLYERPAVVLVVGVNGTGKTTTIGKLAHRLRDRTPSGPRPASSWRSGPSARARTSSARSAAVIRLRSRTTRSGRPRRAAGTSSSSTRRVACIPSRT